MNTKNASTEASAVIIGFLEAHPEPSTADWKQLIEQHPALAGDIADAALLMSSIEPLVEEDARAQVSPELLHRTVSKALNLVHSTPSPVVVDAQRKISAVQGPAIRKLCASLGIAQVQLISNVLVGAVLAPPRLMKRLSELLNAPASALREAFLQRFAAEHVPAFKAEAGKPSVQIRPVSWEEAVRKANLPDADTQKLLSWLD